MTRHRLRGPKSFTYSYDANGNLAHIGDASSNAAFTDYTPTFNSLNQLKKVVAMKGATQHTLRYGYDPVGNLLCQSLDETNDTCDPNGTSGTRSTYGYNELNQLTQVVNYQVGTTPITTGYTYTKTGQREKETKGNGNLVTNTYNDDGTLASISETNPSRPSNDTIVAEQILGYDANNNLASDSLILSKAGGGTNSRDVTLAYTPNNQVSTVIVDGAVKEAYTYDSAGKVISQTVGSVPANFTYFHSRLDKVAYPGSTNPSGAYIYDTLGRLDTATSFTRYFTAGASTQTYSYDGFDNLTVQSQVGPTIPQSETDTSFDSLNRASTVTSKVTINGTTTQAVDTPQYLGTSKTVTSETIDAPADTKTYAYAPDGERLALVDSATSTTAYYSYNQEGDVEALTCGNGSTNCATGATKASYGYTAYGADDTSQTTLDSGPDAPDQSPSPGAFPFNSYRFGAGRLDPSTSNLDLGVGTYNPYMNSFISRAGIAGIPSGQNAHVDLGKFLHDFDWHRFVNDLAGADAGGGIGGLIGRGLGWLACNAAFDVETAGAAVVGCTAAFVFVGTAVGAGAGYQAAECVQGGSCSAQSFATSAGVSLATAGAFAALGGLLRPGASRLATEAITDTADVTAADMAAADVADARVGGVCGVGAGLSFSADTMVATPSGERAIGTLTVGDQVTAYDPRTGKSSTQTVQHVWINHDHDLLDVTLHEEGQDGTATQSSTTDKAQEVATKAHGSQAPPSRSLSPSDETIHTTANHPWLTTDRGWVTAGDLRVGEHVVELGGRTATITALAVHPGAATYYNLTVSNLHTYAVGASRAVVHNCPDPNIAQNVAQRHGRMPAGTAGAVEVTDADTGQSLFKNGSIQGNDNLNPGQSYGANHAETQAYEGAKGFFINQNSRGVPLPQNTTVDIYFSRTPCRGFCSGNIMSGNWTREIQAAAGPGVQVTVNFWRVLPNGTLIRYPSP